MVERWIVYYRLLLAQTNAARSRARAGRDAEIPVPRWVAASGLAQETANAIAETLAALNDNSQNSIQRLAAFVLLSGKTGDLESAVFDHSNEVRVVLSGQFPDLVRDAMQLITDTWTLISGAGSVKNSCNAITRT
jgi:hypothetical protein